MIKINKKIVAWKVVNPNAEQCPHCNGQPKQEQRDDACPECGETMVKDGGCYTCVNGCGFSKCDI